MNNKKIIVFSSVENLADYVLELLGEKIAGVPEGSNFNLALSGGSTPKKIFRYISASNKDVPWSKVRFFWGDERCVPPDHEQSNYNMARLNLFETLKIPEENIYRISGEADPASESVRYSAIMAGNIPKCDGVPRFDLVMLGLGEDGHTASIFPGNNAMFRSKNNCEAVVHPQSGQQRISITGPVINNAVLVVFMVTGREKAKIVAEILEGNGKSNLPASLVNPVNGQLLWLLDADAAALLSRN